MKHLRHRLPSLFGLICCVFISFASTHANADDVKVFLLGGQSNMSGRAPTSGLPTSPVNLQAPQDDVLFYHQYSSSLTTLRPGSGLDFGPEITFGRTIADETPSVKYALIKYAVGGTALYDDWAPPSGPQYVAFKNTVTAGLAALQAAGHTTEIVGMLWHQGESDVTEGQQDNYQTNLTNFIADMRSNYGANLPFLIGEIRRNSVEYDVVADAQIAVAAADPYAAFVPADDLTFKDVWHFDAPGQMVLGQRFAQAYIDTFMFIPFTVDAGKDVVTWSGEPVVLDPNVVDLSDPPSSLTYVWTVDAVSMADTNLSITVTDPDQTDADATVEVTKVAPTGGVTVVTMTLTVDDGINSPIADTMTLHVYDDACDATIGLGLSAFSKSDLNADCITDFADFALIAENWLNETSLVSGPVKNL